MVIKAEAKLYRKVVASLPYDLEFNGCWHSVELRDEKRLYLVGEKHGTRDAVDYTHEKIFPIMAKNPHKWVLLREGFEAHKKITPKGLLNSGIGDQLYFQGLGRLLKIPIYDSGNILSKKIQFEVSKNSGLSVDEIRGWFITNFIMLNRYMNGKELREACRLKMDLSEEEIVKSEQYAFGSREVHERLMKGYNEYIGKNLDKILQENPNKENVLVSVGKAHLPAFSDRYDYIG